MLYSDTPYEIWPSCFFISDLFDFGAMRSFKRQHLKNFANPQKTPLQLGSSKPKLSVPACTEQGQAAK